jgi:hypothetical protein
LESSRRATDAAEAAARAESRRARIADANRRLYEETDRVKSFHGALLLSDVLKEREAQISHGERTRALELIREARFDAERAAAMRVAGTAEERKAAERRRRALEQRDQQLEQLAELRANLEAEAALDKEEGAMIKRQAREEAAAKAAEARAARERAAADAASTAEANDALRAYRAAELEKEREQDRKIEAFARQKERARVAREAHARAKREEAQRERDRIVSVMEADLLRRRAAQTAQHHKEAEEKEAAYEESEAVKAAERAHDLEMIERSRSQQLALRAAAREAAREEAARHAARLRARNAELEEEEAAERTATLERNKALQRAHVRQIAKKQSRAAERMRAEVLEAERATQILREDDELFRHYADACVEEWARSGKDIRPMQIELAKRRDKVTG